jgi:hypothetical protein
MEIDYLEEIAQAYALTVKNNDPNVCLSAGYTFPALAVASAPAPF